MAIVVSRYGGIQIETPFYLLRSVRPVTLRTTSPLKTSQHLCAPSGLDCYNKGSVFFNSKLTFLTAHRVIVHGKMYLWNEPVAKYTVQHLKAYSELRSQLYWRRRILASCAVNPRSGLLHPKVYPAWFAPQCQTPSQTHREDHINVQKD